MLKINFFQGPCEDDSTIRGDLFQNWAHLNNWYKKQPIDKVQDYLGTKIAFYFAWLGFYTRLLVLPAFIGLLVMIYGIYTLPEDKLRYIGTFENNIEII